METAEQKLKTYGVALCCIVLQCVAVCCSVLQCVTQMLEQLIGTVL